MMTEPNHRCLRHGNHHCALTRMIIWNLLNLVLPEQHSAKPSMRRRHHLPDHRQHCPDLPFQGNQCRPEHRPEWKGAVRAHKRHNLKYLVRNAEPMSPRRTGREITCQSQRQPRQHTDPHRPVRHRRQLPLQLLQAQRRAKDRSEEQQMRQMIPDQAAVEKLPKLCMMDEQMPWIKPRTTTTGADAPRAESHSRAGASCIGIFESYHISGKELPQAQDSGGVSA